MSTLGIFTVKVFYYDAGRYYTDGGFGIYLSEVASFFERVVLVAHVSNGSPPAGCYQVDTRKIEVIHLPITRGEHRAIMYAPITAWKCWQAAKLMDVAHARMPDITGVLGAMACRYRKIPCFHQIIDDWAEMARAISWSKRGGLGALLKFWLYVYDYAERAVSRGQLVFAQGESCYRKHRGPRTVLAVSSSHRLADIAELRPRFTGAPYTILNVGRLVATKNQLLIIKSLAQLRQSGVDWRFVQLGAGPQEDALRQAAEEFGVSSHITWVGNVPHGKSLWAYFDSADVFVLSSRSEGTPKVVLEALARGLPVVASAVSGVPSVIRHEQTGLLFRDNDAAELVSNLDRILGDHALRARCQASGLVLARGRTIELQTSEMIKHVKGEWPQLKLSREPGCIQEK